MYEYRFFVTYKLPGYDFKYLLSLEILTKPIYHKVSLHPDHFKLLMYKVIVIQNSDMKFEIPSPLS